MPLWPLSIAECLLSPGPPSPLSLVLAHRGVSRGSRLADEWWLGGHCECRGEQGTEPWSRVSPPEPAGAWLGSRVSRDGPGSLLLLGQVTCNHGPCNREGFQRQHTGATEEEEDAARMPSWFGRRVPGKAGVRVCSKDQGRAVGGTGREREEARAGEHGGAPDTLQAS